MTKKEYFDRCAEFDWFYDFSDDYFRVALPGKALHAQLQEAYACFPEWKLVYMAWHDYYFSGKPFGIDKKKKPEYSDFGIKGDDE